MHFIWSNSESGFDRATRCSATAVVAGTKPPAILFAAAWPCHVNEYMISSGPDYTAYSASSAADSCCGGSIELPVMLIALATNTRVGCQIKSIPPSIHPGLRAS